MVFVDPVFSSQGITSSVGLTVGLTAISLDLGVNRELFKLNSHRFRVLWPYPVELSSFGRASQEFGSVSVAMVSGNRLIFGSVSSNKRHYEEENRRTACNQKKYGNVLAGLVSSKFLPTDFDQASKPEREDISTMICFK